MCTLTVFWWRWGGSEDVLRGKADSAIKARDEAQLEARKAEVVKVTAVKQANWWRSKCTDLEQVHTIGVLHGCK